MKKKIKSSIFIVKFVRVTIAQLIHPPCCTDNISFFRRKRRYTQLPNVASSSSHHHTNTHTSENFSIVYDLTRCRRRISLPRL